MIPVIFAPCGLTLTADEQAFFRDVQPYGFILFARNVDNPDQVRELVSGLKACVTHDPCPVLIDQEGGRVARLRPPHWPEYPTGAAFGALAEQKGIEAAKEAAALNSRLIAEDLTVLGINVDCLPVLDVPVDGGHDVIGDRAYGRDPQVVTEVARAACEGLMAGGVLPVIKHIPGHGRAGVDSHLELPKVDTPLDELRQSDFLPFKALSEMPFAMTAHVLFGALDSEQPATTSSSIIANVIRGELGFDGVLISDDLNMEALGGSLDERASAAMAAGCDVALHCNGELDQMREIASVLTPVTPDQESRLMKAMAGVVPASTFDVADARTQRDALLAGVAV